MKLKWLMITFLVFALNSAEGRRRPIFWIIVDTPIHPIAAQYIHENIRKATEEGAVALVLQMDTPGGLVTSMQTIVQDILASEVPIVGYVAPSGAHAASAGFYILMATDIAVMTTGTRTGASTPILGQGDEDKESRDKTNLRKKVENDLIALIKSLTERRHRNTELAVKTITEAMVYNETEALHKGLIDFIAFNPQDLLKKLNGRTVQMWNGRKVTLATHRGAVETHPMSFRYRFLSFIMDPNVIFILLTLGMLGLYVEFTHPGLYFPGITGLVFIILTLVSTQIMPINWGAIAMIALAFLLFLLEIKITSYGLLTLGGLISLALGGLMLTDTPLNEWKVSRTFLFAIVTLIGLVVVVILWLVIRTHRHTPYTGQESLVGQLGWAHTKLAPGRNGWVFVDGTLWQAVSDQEVLKGGRVRVRKVHPGMTVEVEPVISETNQKNNLEVSQ